MAYVYAHIREDNNTIFYIGISKQNNNYKRAYVRFRTNNIWNKIVTKTSYNIIILYDNITLKKAKELEIELINKYGRLDLGTGILANLTNGGDGVESYVFTKKQKQKLSESQKELYKNGYINPNLGKTLSDTVRNKISDSCKGRQAWNKGVKLNKEQKEKLRNYRLNTKHTEQTKNKISIASKGKIRRCTKLINTETGEIFNSIKEAYTKYNICEATFFRQLKKPQTIYKRLN